MKIHKLLFPDRCIFCGKLTDEDEYEICTKCRDKSENIIKASPDFQTTKFVDQKIAAAWYKDEVRAAVHRFKYNQKPGYARAFAREMYKQYILNRCSYDMITYVPSNRYTVFKRGYNQAKLLAVELSKYTKLEVVQTVRKVRKTKPMFDLKPEERRANVLGAYEVCCDVEKIKNKRILIVDDIFTTGSTVSEIAKTLKLAGSGEVGCATFAYKKS